MTHFFFPYLFLLFKKSFVWPFLETQQHFHVFAVLGSHRADRFPRPSFFATACRLLTGLAPPSLAPLLSPLLPFPFLPGLAFLALALSSSPLAAGGRERYTSRAERPLNPRSCRLLISLSSSSMFWPRQAREHSICGYSAFLWQWMLLGIVLLFFFFKPYLGLARQGRAASWLGPVHEQLTGVGVDEAQSVFQHVRWDLLEND